MAGVAPFAAVRLVDDAEDFDVLETCLVAGALADGVADLVGFAVVFVAVVADLRAAGFEEPFEAGFPGAELDDGFVVRAGMDGSCGPE